MVEHFKMSRRSSTSLPPRFFAVARPALNFIDGPGEDHVLVAPFRISDKANFRVQEEPL